MIFALAMLSTVLAAEAPWRGITFMDRHIWSIQVFEDGGTAILVGDENFLKARAGTIQLVEIQKKWGPVIVDSQDKNEGGIRIGILQGDAQSPEWRRAYLTNVQLARDLITEAIQKGEVPDKGSVEGFNRFLRKYPPLGLSGLQLRDDQYATDRHLNAFGPDQELPKPPGDKPGKNGTRTEKNPAPLEAIDPSQLPATGHPKAATSPSPSNSMPDRKPVGWILVIALVLLLLIAFGLRAFIRKQKSGVD